MKIMKKITVSILMAAMTAGAIMSSVSAYSPDKDWQVSYVNQLPSRPQGSCEAKVAVFTKGHQTYCEKISGSNDCYVLVKAEGIQDFIITQVGYSSIKNYSNIYGVDEVIFHFYGRSTSTCNANGTVGYNM